MNNREYDQLDSLSSSSSAEISRLSVIVKNLKDRIESLERNQTDIMDKFNTQAKGNAKPSHGYNYDQEKDSLVTGTGTPAEDREEEREHQGG